MTNIATLTLNPTIDVAYEVDRMFHTRKMRTKSEFYSPGGGGINVARVFVRLGGNARSYNMAQSARSCDFGQVEERTLNAGLILPGPLLTTDLVDIGFHGAIVALCDVEHPGEEALDFLIKGNAIRIGVIGDG